MVYRTKPSPKHPYAIARFAALMGCSLQAVTTILRPHGYTLLQFPMEDAWFVKTEFVELFVSHSNFSPGPLKFYSPG